MIRIRHALAAVLVTAATGVGLGYAAGAHAENSDPQVVEHHEGHWVVDTRCRVESDCFAAWDGDHWTINWDPS